MFGSDRIEPTRGMECWVEVSCTDLIAAGLPRLLSTSPCPLCWADASFKGRRSSHLLPLPTAVLLSAVEREWTKTLCGGNSEALAQLNAAMKRIDLTCLIASPILVGLVMQVRGRSPGSCNWPPALQHGYRSACKPCFTSSCCPKHQSFAAHPVRPIPRYSPACLSLALLPPAARRRAAHGCCHACAAVLEPH